MGIGNAIGGMMVFIGLTIIGAYYLDRTEPEKARNPVARQKGVNAFFALDKQWSRGAILYAGTEIATGKQMDPEEPWLLIAEARMHLVAGYTSHNHVEAKRVDEALALAEKAAKRDPHDAVVQSFYAGRLYQKGQNEKAWEVLQRAMLSEPNNPYPFYRVADFVADAKDATSLRVWLDKAKTVDSKDRYKDHRIELERKLCALESDLKCVDAKYREEITLEPNNPWAYGNYGTFLAGMKRYKEAKVQLQKALAIMEYPVARNRLNEVEAILKSQAIGAAK
jgi:Tfp pilus assembly protein PilF